MRRQHYVMLVLTLAFTAPYAWKESFRSSHIGPGDFTMPKAGDSTPAKAGDATMAKAGRELFLHEWTPGDPLAGTGDGVGPVFNAKSCAACHRQGGVGGSGPLDANVNMFTFRSGKKGGKAKQGVLHAHAVAPEFQEVLSHVHRDISPMFQWDPPGITAGRVLSLSFDSQNLALPREMHLSQRKTPALFGAKLLDEIPDSVIIANALAQRLKWGISSRHDRTSPAGRALRFADGRVGRFGWKAQSASLAAFVQAACANELGLGNPGQAQPQPLGRPDYQPPGLDLTLAQCDQITEFIRSLPRPVERMPMDPSTLAEAKAGKQLFHRVGCADCHTPDVGAVKGLYSDLLLHSMGQELEAGGGYNDPPLEDPNLPNKTGPRPSEWRTPPLWGVARSAPYLHDGRARTLGAAIRMHGGQGQRSVTQYEALTMDERGRLLTFLKTLDTP